MTREQNLVDVVIAFFVSFLFFHERSATVAASLGWDARNGPPLAEPALPFFFFANFRNQSAFAIRSVCKSTNRLMQSCLYRVLPSFTEFFYAFSRFTGYYPMSLWASFWVIEILLGFTEFYLVLLGFT